MPKIKRTHAAVDAEAEKAKEQVRSTARACSFFLTEFFCSSLILHAFSLILFLRLLLFALLATQQVKRDVEKTEAKKKRRERETKRKQGAQMTKGFLEHGLGLSEFQINSGCVTQSAHE